MWITVVLKSITTESPEELQKMLDMMGQYTEEWKFSFKVITLTAHMTLNCSYETWLPTYCTMDNAGPDGAIFRIIFIGCCSFTEANNCEVCSYSVLDNGLFLKN